MLLFPNFRERLFDLNFTKFNFFVSRNVQLQIIARLILHDRFRVRRFEHEFLDERGDIVIADDAKTIRFLRRNFRRRYVYKNFPIGDAHGESLQADANWFAFRRAVGDIEAAVVFRTFDQISLHQTGGEMRVAVRANAVGRIKISIGGAIDGIGFFVVIETDDIFHAQVLGTTNFNPAVHKCATIAGDYLLIWRRFFAIRGRWNYTLHMISGVFHLTQNGRNNFAPRLNQTHIRLGHVSLDHFVQLRQRVIRHERKHVMLDMIIHVPIKKTIDWIHVNRPAIQAMVEDIFREPGVLRVTVNRHQPATPKIRQADEHQWQKAVLPNRERED